MAQTIIDQSKNHVALIEEQWKDMENRLEMQCQEMEIRMKEMSVHTERSMNSIISQVP
jgi:malate synthase